MKIPAIVNFGAEFGVSWSRKSISFSTGYVYLVFGFPKRDCMQPHKKCSKCKPFGYLDLVWQLTQKECCENCRLSEFKGSYYVIWSGLFQRVVLFIAREDKALFFCSLFFINLLLQFLQQLVSFKIDLFMTKRSMIYPCGFDLCIVAIFIHHVADFDVAKVDR